jgi:hypothetical protein
MMPAMKSAIPICIPILDFPKALAAADISLIVKVLLGVVLMVL